MHGQGVIHGRGACVVGGHVWWGVCVVGGMCGGGIRGRGRQTCVAGETATAVGGLHPTGMHSCFFFKVMPISDLLL